MKIRVQLFATDWDELTKEYTNSKNTAQTELNSLDSQKQAELDSYNTNYNNQLNEYNSLLEQQQQNVDTWAENQKQAQQAQTDFELSLIEQQKAETQKQTDAEMGDAYIDYQKGINQFGGNAEIMAANGLTGTGFSKNEQIAMNITYQNRVSTAKAALTKANTEYSNQIQQALLNNDATLADIAYQQMVQSYQIALQGFEYKNTMYNNKLNYETSLNESYYNKKLDLQSRIDNYTTQIASIQQYQDELEQQKEENRQWWANYNENKRQFNEQMAEEKRQYNQTYNATYNSPYTDGGSENQNTPKTADDQYTYAKTVFGNDASTVNKKDYYFDNGYQPRYVNNVKLGKTGVKVKEVFGTSLGSKVADQNIWGANGKYYYWDGSVKDYVELDGENLKKFKNAVSGWDKFWHKAV
jgi:hypothetical protein